VSVGIVVEVLGVLFSFLHAIAVTKSNAIEINVVFCIMLFFY